MSLSKEQWHVHTAETIADLFAHMQWADAKVWAAVLACGDARGDERLRGHLHHMHVVQWAFLRMWRGEPRDAPFPEFETIKPLLGWAREYYVAARETTAAWTGDRLNAEQILPWAALVEKKIGRKADPSTVSETAMQVAMHSQYHRGQVNARLREIGGDPPLVDYIAWVWLGRPAPEWPGGGERRGGSVTRLSKADVTGKIAVENVNVPGRVTNVNAGKYEPMRKALLKVLPRKAPGLTQAEMLRAVLAHLPNDVFPGGATASWWVKTVQLDLEAKGAVVRDRTKPLTWRRVR